ncbi:uncharacterized protein LOC144584911 isoform X1 [Pogona vitticeps]
MTGSCMVRDSAFRSSVQVMDGISGRFRGSVSTAGQECPWRKPEFTGQSRPTREPKSRPTRGNPCCTFQAHARVPFPGKLRSQKQRWINVVSLIFLRSFRNRRYF